ncbi:hypothetical protein BgiBS90_028350, partial [Biomphalaria glabrata]
MGSLQTTCDTVDCTCVSVCLDTPISSSTAQSNMICIRLLKTLLEAEDVIGSRR